MVNKKIFSPRIIGLLFSILGLALYLVYRDSSGFFLIAYGVGCWIIPTITP